MTPVEALLLVVLVAWFGAMTVRDLFVIREWRKRERLRREREELLRRLGIHPYAEERLRALLGWRP